MFEEYKTSSCKCWFINTLELVVDGKVQTFHKVAIKIDPQTTDKFNGWKGISGHILRNKRRG